LAARWVAALQQQNKAFAAFAHKISNNVRDTATKVLPCHPRRVTPWLCNLQAEEFFECLICPTFPPEPAAPP
jgi:hypothetical protein